MKMYGLLANCIPAAVILKQLTYDLIKCLDNSLKPQIVAFAAEYVYDLMFPVHP